MCIGAAMPDIVDGARGIVRGHLGQGIGHGLFGIAILCTPIGIVLAYATRPLFKRWVIARASFPIVATSVLVGSFSHSLFDFISHDKFLWFAPFWEPERFFPEMWYARWLEIKTPFYEDPYPVGPHLMVWLFSSVLGAVMFFRRGR